MVLVGCFAILVCISQFSYIFLFCLPVIVYLKQSSRFFCSLAGNIGHVNLEALGKHYGIIFKGPSHRAMPDVQALSKIFQKITLGLKLTRDGLMSEASIFYDFRKVSRI